MIIARRFVYLTVTCCFAFAGCFRGTGTVGPQYLPEATVAATRSANSSYKVLHYFGKGSDGYAPQSSLIAVNATLYGATFDGGSSNLGAVYSVTPTGTEKVLHSFAGGSDGANPESALVDVNGTLYGTTPAGGSSNAGTVYSVTLTGKEKVLYSFTGGLDGANPESGLIDVNGTLYGTTVRGGNATTPECFPNGCGTVYTLNMRGAEKVLHSFAGGSDGTAPVSGLIDVDETLYGTTGGGGGAGCGLPPRETRASEIMLGRGCGTVYSIGADRVEKVLYSFNGGTDGLFPTSALLIVKGSLY
ncbi:MAG TPA: choice-of-anchor tandem repeat GloVer-containing protein, partial [Candidatus Cybelea sp.]|nr:choice-of-anchor tandem repeat GloVer-containing protein [Candidatus Cybelea sp.]